MLFYRDKYEEYKGYKYIEEIGLEDVCFFEMILLGKMFLNYYWKY